MGAATGVPGEGPASVDQVAAARDWLRSHGIDAPDAGAAAGSRLIGSGGPAAGVEPGDAAAGRRSRSPSTPRARSTGRRSPREGTDEESPSDVQPAGARTRGAGESGTEEVDADPEDVARTIVLRKLAAQARTRAELERALKGRAVPEDAATAVLDRMGEVGLVDDAAFARDWVASRQQRRHLSRSALRRELQTKGVNREVIDDALADVGGADEHRAALDLGRRRAASMGGLPREVAYRRLGGVLARRGFSASVIAQVLGEVLGGCQED